MKQAIGDFLLRRLEEAGVKHLFGVPGDYNLELMQQLETRRVPIWVGNCNELNAAYAVDGYARVNGIGALIVTNGVGALSAMNGIAGAYCEHVPVICICGSIPQMSIELGSLMHHTMADGSQNRFLRAFSEVTIAQAALTPENAAREIDRLIRLCWRQKRPVYMELPSDIGYLSIEVPVSPFVLSYEPSDEERLTACSAKICERLVRAQAPAFLLDMDTGRFGVAERIARLAQQLNIPVATLPGSKSMFPEDHARFAGVYSGAASNERLRKIVETSDCLITCGYRRVDSTSGFFTDAIPASSIAVNAQSTAVDGQQYQAVYLVELIERLIQDTMSIVPKTSSGSNAPAVLATSNLDEKPLNQRDLWAAIQRFILPGDVIVAEDGTASAGFDEITLPSGVTYITQPIWGSIGFSVGCFLGTLTAAPSRRQILFVGDGSFQLTAQELSTIIRHGHTPYIFLLNNRGYTIERTILGRTALYNDIAQWNYSEFVNSMSGQQAVETLIVQTKHDLDAALAASHQHLVFIEVLLDQIDAPVGLIRAGHAAANLDFGPRGPQSTPGSQIEENDVQ